MFTSFLTAPPAPAPRPAPRLRPAPTLATLRAAVTYRADPLPALLDAVRGTVLDQPPADPLPVMRAPDLRAALITAVTKSDYQRIADAYRRLIAFAENRVQKTRRMTDCAPQPPSAPHCYTLPVGLIGATDLSPTIGANPANVASLIRGEHMRRPRKPRVSQMDKADAQRAMLAYSVELDDYRAKLDAQTRILAIHAGIGRTNRHVPIAGYAKTRDPLPARETKRSAQNKRERKAAERKRAAARAANPLTVPGASLRAISQYR